ncbi:hypothetical protein NA57DRAFT_71098 [Rhizodiscina lignyota]|uniref:Uncharacterized protein n=1 Tax=Rhizodiscina lignyota TaxID=1504668 RepID=A0A9P4IUX9_9PEZI|nr:hypothetical protein NA57DRAFT_71098 [Rhizodiscina lignyota]
MYFATAFVALLASTFAVASPGGAPGYGKSTSTKPSKSYKTECSTKTIETYSYTTIPKTILETKTVWVPVTKTKEVPTYFLSTCYETKTKVKEEKKSKIVKKPYTKVFYYTSTQYYEVPYTFYSTETEVKKIPTKTESSYVTKTESKSVCTETEYKTEKEKCYETSTYCTTKTAGSYGW